MTGQPRTPEGLDVEQYRGRLLEMRAQLELDIANQRQDQVEQDGGPAEPGSGQHWEHSGFGYGDHQADDGTELFEREKLLTLERTLQDHLHQVQDALRRIEEGTYGACAVCGRPIGEERLDVMPESALCIEHKAEAERKSGAGSAPVPNAYKLEPQG
jgi:RNA polymerase-binding transcription factor DksA